MPERCAPPARLPRVRLSCVQMTLHAIGDDRLTLAPIPAPWGDAVARATNCADAHPMVGIEGRRAPRIDNQQRLGGPDSGVKFGREMEFGLVPSMRAHSSLGERRRAWAGIAYRGVCPSPNAGYLVRKPADDKCISFS
jgi:virulence-associated protein VagC